MITIFTAFQLAIICYILSEQLMSVVFKFFPSFFKFACSKCITYWLSLTYCLFVFPISLELFFIPAFASFFVIIMEKYFF